MRLDALTPCCQLPMSVEVEDVHPSNTGTELLSCRGCDKPFVIEYSLFLTTKYYRLLPLGENGLTEGLMPDLPQTEAPVMVTSARPGCPTCGSGDRNFRYASCTDLWHDG